MSLNEYSRIERSMEDKLYSGLTPDERKALDKAIILVKKLSKENSK